MPIQKWRVGSRDSTLGSSNLPLDKVERLSSLHVPLPGTIPACRVGEGERAVLEHVIVLLLSLMHPSNPTGDAALVQHCAWDSSLLSAKGERKLVEAGMSRHQVGDPGGIRLVSLWMFRKLLKGIPF